MSSSGILSMTNLTTNYRSVSVLVDEDDGVTLFENEDKEGDLELGLDCVWVFPEYNVPNLGSSIGSSSRARGLEDAHVGLFETLEKLKGFLLDEVRDVEFDLKSNGDVLVLDFKGFGCLYVVPSVDVVKDGIIGVGSSSKSMKAASLDDLSEVFFTRVPLWLFSVIANPLARSSFSLTLS
ncbi:hypothetical protein WICPIJ_007327 [Wickerhamomyces pijperi]|uniref:Uncharacterized protein n=1 Tax=Wickerhamomyces pijperi TaxID=599730 RepID=A0A9P8TK70_WICPI|nr:hypothetical protein WICPIJ_007327 [Wickerhamomyces pijperi]